MLISIWSTVVSGKRDPNLLQLTPPFWVMNTPISVAI
jgi:hypothetical protein